MTQPDPKSLYASEQGDVEQKRQRLRQALADHEPKLRDAAQAFVYVLGLARDRFQVAELAKEAVQHAAQRVLEEVSMPQMPDINHEAKSNLTPWCCMVPGYPLRLCPPYY